MFIVGDPRLGGRASIVDQNALREKHRRATIAEAEWSSICWNSQITSALGSPEVVGSSPAACFCNLRYAISH